MTVDTDRCDGCGRCVEACPKSAVKLEIQEMGFEEKTVASVSEEHRKKLKYTCFSCRPEGGGAPCVLSCHSGAIRCVWHMR